jgi:hypothetical protein
MMGVRPDITLQVARIAETRLADAPRLLYLAHGTPRDAAKAPQAEGWRTVQGLEPVADSRAEAQRLGCSHVLIDGRIEEV